MSSTIDLNLNKESLTNDDEKLIIEEKVTLSSENNQPDQQQQSNGNESDHENEKPAAPDEWENDKDETNMDAQPLFEQPIILEGKRSRKPTLRLEIAELTPTRKELHIPNGHGKALGEIEYINYQITHASTDDLSRMRTICFGRRGNKATIRKNLREFKGFDFEYNSQEYQKHFNILTKMKKDQLRSISMILGLPSTGRNTDHAERILKFLMEPIDEGKRIPGKKIPARTSKKRRTVSDDSMDISKKSKKAKKENDKDQHSADYVYKPGKKSPVKYSSNGVQHETDQSIKSKEETETIINKSTKDDENVLQENRNDISENQPNEQPDQNAVTMKEIVQDEN